MNSPADTQPAPIRLPAWLLRFILINFLLMDGVMMWREYGITSYGLDAAMIYLCLGFVLPVLTLACLPCFVLAPQLRSQDLAQRRRALLHSAWPMVLALLAGTALCFGDWDKLWFVVTPLVPPLVILAAVASKSRRAITDENMR
jgi:hypothetical protein